MNFFDKKLTTCARKILNLSYEIFKTARKQVKAEIEQFASKSDILSIIAKKESEI